jgi:DNA recombination protein RmuC
MDFLIPLVIGLALGVVITLVIAHLKKKETEGLRDQMKDSFAALSFEALTRNTEEFLKLAQDNLSKQTKLGEKELEGKKQLINQVLEAMKKDLEGVEEMVTRFEKDREEKFGALSESLKNTASQTARLQETTDQLRTALASSKARGQWGERMAEDVLRLAGFIEGVNYRKQKALESGTTIPDFTFLLPQDLKVNMDVKFPLDNYWKYLETDVESEREKHKNQFLRDVKGRIKEVTTRDYINPEENTLDYVLVFIPNEQVYAFINESDATVLDEAMKHKVVLCSPLTLYAILAVIRQAIDNFNLEQTAGRILSLLGAFNKQWKMFIAAFDKMGRRIGDVQKEFDNLTGTRKNQLERQLLKIEELRTQKEIPIEGLDGMEIEGGVVVEEEVEEEEDPT